MDENDETSILNIIGNTKKEDKKVIQQNIKRIICDVI